MESLTSFLDTFSLRASMINEMADMNKAYSWYDEIFFFLDGTTFLSIWIVGREKILLLRVQGSYTYFSMYWLLSELFWIVKYGFRVCQPSGGSDWYQVIRACILWAILILLDSNRCSRGGKKLLCSSFLLASLIEPFSELESLDLLLPSECGVSTTFLPDVYSLVSSLPEIPDYMACWRTTRSLSGRLVWWVQFLICASIHLKDLLAGGSVQTILCPIGLRWEVEWCWIPFLIRFFLWWNRIK